jgi:mRNA interferase RelE/StbE
MYKLVLSREAERFFERCDKALAKKLSRCFESLEKNPRVGNNIKALKGRFAGALRYRVGDCRVIYTIDDRWVTVFVITIASRGDVYE